MNTDAPLRTGAVLTWSEIAGVPPASDWHAWIESGRGPKPDPPGQFQHSHISDLEQLAQLGLSEIAITIEWALLEPSPGHYDRAAIEGLRQVLSHINTLELDVWAVLVDGTLPGWFAIDERGFSDERSRNLIWPRHVEWVGETFGDLVSGWVPQREPVQREVKANLLALGPPGKSDTSATATAVAGALKADLEAWRVLRGSMPVATYQTARLFVAPTDNVPAAQHCRSLDGWYRREWIESLSVDAPDAFDRVVLQVRPPVEIDANGGWHPIPTSDPIEQAERAITAVTDEIERPEFVIAADLASMPADHAETLGALLGISKETGATGWWQTSPIDGWHWERGNDGLGSIIRADRSATDAAEVLGTAVLGN